MSLTRNRRSPTDVRLAGKSPRRSSTTAAASNELIVVPVDHIVRFYATDDALVDTLAQIVETGLDAGEACLVIATGAHRARLHARLRRRGRDMPEARRDGRYRALDADHMLQTLMVAGELDPVRFKRKIERAMRRAAQGGRAVRVLSELGAQLWLAGSRKAALRLEALWNELRQRSTPMFSLLCAFPEHLLAMGDARTALAAAHGRQTRAVRSAVAPPLLSAHARVQAVARLRRDNHALQAEVARRQRMEERLRRTELRYRDLFEASRDGILTIEPDTGRISEANHAAAELLGRPRERIVGHDLWQLGLFPTRASARAALSAMRGQPPPQWEALPLPSRNGRERVAQMAASFVRSDGFATIQCTLRDVSERKQLERDAAARAAELEAIQAVTDVALAHSSLDDLLRELMERLRTVLGVDNVAVLLLDATGRELSLYQARGPEEEVAGRVHVPLGRGVAGLIAATREPLIIGDLRTVPVENPFLRERLRSLMGVPLLVADRLIGVMHVSTILPHAFAPREVRLLQLVADRAARAIERAQLQQEADQARHAAVERANQLYATIEAIADGVVVFDYTGRLTQMNATAQRLLGFAGTPRYTAASAGYGSRHTRSAAGRALTAEHWPVQRVLRGEVITGSQAVDLTIQGAGGRDLDVSVSGAPVLDSDGAVQGAVCVFRDVTAQRQLERRTNEALEALLAMAGALLDVPGDDAAGTAPSEAPARHATLPTAEGAPPAARRLAHLTCEVLACQRVGILAIDTETRLMTPIAVAGLTPDQERQWWADQAARPQSFGADSDPELLRRFDAGEVIVVDMTKAPYASRPNPYGISTTLVAPMRLGPRLIGMLAVDFGGAPHHFTEQEHALAGAVARLAALVIERERLLREREEARASALVAQETTRQMHTFLGIAGHEFRTPVTSIKAGVQIAERALQAYLREVAPTANTRPLQRAQSLLLRADQQANRLNRLIEDILDATRSQAGTLQLRNEMGDLAAVVRQTVETHLLTWPERAITLDLPDTPVNLRMDADRIEQVVANFLTNALKYSAEDQPVSVRLTVNGRVARLAVRDHGPGLPPALHTLVWEAFYRADADRQQTGSPVGLGLGLHICRTLIERHGGRVGVQSVEGEGATFWFELPLGSAKAADKGNGGMPRDATQPAV